MSVSREYFRQQLDSAFPGGEFSILEARARMSVPKLSHYSVGDKNYGNNFASAWAQASEVHGTLTRNWLVSDNWSLDWSLLPAAEKVQQTRQESAEGELIILPMPKTKSKKLPDCIRSYLVKKWGIDRDLVNKATFTRSNPITLKFIYSSSIGPVSYTHHFSGTAGFTWGYNIDFLDTSFDPSDGIDADEVALAGHEFKHVEQFANDRNFTVKYLTNYLVNLADATFFKSITDIYAEGSGAYENIDYEKNANEFQEKIRTDIKENGNPCKPFTANGKNYGQ